MATDDRTRRGLTRALAGLGIATGALLTCPQLAGRVVVCVTQDDLEEPGDTVVQLRADAPVPAGG